MLKITLNLLPPQKKEALRQGFVLAYVQTMVFLFCLIAVLIAAGLVPVRLMLGADHEALLRQTAPESDEFTVSVAEIRDINAFLKRVDGLQTGFVPWSSALGGITELAPAGVRLESLQLMSPNLVVVSGTAATRADLLAFQQKLSAAPFLSKVDSPLSNILQRQNVRFEIETTYALPEAAGAPAPENKK